MSKTDLIGILIALWTSGILTAVVHAGIELINANTKNKRLLAFTKWAEQAVAFAENNAETPLEKKNAAKKFLYDRLISNKLPFNFSDEQVDAEIEKAVAALHDWHPEIKEEKK